jgi:hypothetical protein
MGDILTPLGQMTGLIDDEGDAAEIVAESAENSVAEQRRQFDLMQENMRPWLTSGTSAVNQLSAGLQPGGQFASTPTFQFDQSRVQMDPGYAFRQQQGVNAIAASGAAAGNLGSGNLGVALQNYGQELGSQEYGAAYQRAYGSQLDQFNSQLSAQNNQFNRLSGIAGTGQTTANQLGGAGMNMAQGVGNTLMNSANNQSNLMMQGVQNFTNNMNGIGQTGANAYGAYRQNQLYDQYQGNGALYNDAGGDINNVDFGEGWN